MPGGAIPDNDFAGRFGLAGRTYYLVPDGKVGEKPYALLVRGMQDEKRWAVAKVAMHGREHVVLLRPVGRLLVMQFLHFASQVREPEYVEELVSDVPLDADERELAVKLLDAKATKRLDYSAYRDHYKDDLRRLIEAKVAGKEIVAPPAAEPAPVVNLMDALRQSLAQAEREAAKPPKKTTASRKPAKKRKSS